MNKESDILKIVEEDILRILGERKGKGSLNIIKEEINIILSYISEAIERLKKEGLIQAQQGFFELTKTGERIAKDILKKHVVFENYLKRTRTEKEAHEIANILEHYISEEVIKNIKELSTFKGKGVPLTELKLPKELLIANITIPDNELFERIISMGIFPGEKIKIMNEIPNGIVIKIKNKKFVLDENIAKEIMVIKL